MAVLFKEGVTLVPSPGGVRILAALWQVSFQQAHDITVTAGSNGTHSGPDDPHYRGDAYDIRIHDWDNPQLLLSLLINTLADTDPGKFFAFIEDDGTPNAHIHAQVRKGTVYP